MLPAEPRQRVKDCQGNLVEGVDRNDLATMSGGKLPVATEATSQNLLSGDGLAKSGHGGLVVRPLEGCREHGKSGRTTQMQGFNGVHRGTRQSARVVNFEETPRPSPRE